jgi:Domain of unknown function (DUF4383)
VSGAPVQDVARVVGIVFLVVGVAGFVPGLTTNLYDGLEFSGSDGTSELLGTFAVSVLHNIVHGLFGLAGLALAATPSGARTYLLGGGAVYLALFALGIVDGAAWLPADRADQWLHLALGVGMIAAAVVATRRRETAPGAAS